MTPWKRSSARGSVGLLAAALLGAGGAPSAAAPLFLCAGGQVVAGPERPGGCRAVEPGDLHLRTAQNSLDELRLQVQRNAARLEQLEHLLTTRPQRRALPPASRAPALDTYDSDDRLRDLGQDIDRRLEAIGR